MFFKQKGPYQTDILIETIPDSNIASIRMETETKQSRLDKSIHNCSVFCDVIKG